ncbi:hypothetical protein [Streptomyces sp. NPDC005336]|uniref:hypothetical protein n=1 Tax=unclassified Streptomyces TaxID=2593676 RepID=UPI0033B0F4BA
MTSQICARRDRPTNEPVIVGMEHGGSVAGRRHYACPGCAPSFPKQLDPFEVLSAMRRAQRQGLD